MRLVWRLVLVLVSAAGSSFGAVAQSSQYFVVRVIDDETGRGVPLVELKLPKSAGRGHVDNRDNVARNAGCSAPPCCRKR